MEGSSKSTIKSFILKHFSRPSRPLRTDPEQLEYLSRQMTYFCFEHPEFNADRSGEMFLNALDLYFDFLLDYLALKQLSYYGETPPEYKEEKKIRKFRYIGAELVIKLIYNNGVSYFEEEVLVGLLQKVWQLMSKRSTHLLVFNFQPMLFSNFFVDVPEDKDDGFESCSDEEEEEEVKDEDEGGAQEEGKEEAKQEEEAKGGEEEEGKEEEENKCTVDVAPRGFLSDNPMQAIREKVLQVGEFPQTEEERVQQMQTISFISQVMYYYKDHKDPCYRAVIDLLPEFVCQLERCLSHIFGPDSPDLPPRCQAPIPSSPAFQQSPRFYYLFLGKCLLYLLNDFLSAHQVKVKTNEYLKQKEGELAPLVEKINGLAMRIGGWLKGEDEQGFEVRQLNLVSTMMLGNAVLYNINYSSKNTQLIKDSIQCLQSKLIDLSQILKTPQFTRRKQQLLYELLHLVSLILTDADAPLTSSFLSAEFLPALLSFFALDSQEKELMQSNPQKLFQQHNNSYAQHYKQLLTPIANLLATKFGQQSQALLSKVVMNFKEAMAAEDFEAAGACLNFLQCCTDILEKQVLKQIKHFVGGDVAAIVKQDDASVFLRQQAIKTVHWHMKTLAQEVQDEMIRVLASISMSESNHYLVQGQSLLATGTDIIDVVDIYMDQQKNVEILQLYKKILYKLQEHPYINDFMFSLLDLFKDQKSFLLELDNDLLCETLRVAMDNLTIPIAKQAIFADADYEAEADENKDYFQNVSDLLCQNILFGLLQYKYPSKIQNPALFKKGLKEKVKRVFKARGIMIMELDNDQLTRVLYAFMLFFLKTQTAFACVEADEENKQVNLQTYRQQEDSCMSDVEVLRYMVQNNLYSFNSDCKQAYLLANKDPKKQSSKPQSGEPEEEKYQDQTRYQNVDQMAYLVLFVLLQLKDSPISVLFPEDDDDFGDTKYHLFQMLRVYTKMLAGVQMENRSNHISYWMLTCLLLETCQLEELDQEYIDYHDNAPPESFFIFEESLKLFPGYIKKLMSWFNASIFLFYFQVLNLYYWYDAERTYSALMAAFPEQNQLIYARHFQLPAPDADLSQTSFTDPEVRGYLISHKGCLWTLLGLKGLLGHAKTADEAKAFIKENCRALIKNAEIVMTGFLGRGREETKEFLAYEELIKEEQESTEQLELEDLVEEAIQLDGADDVLDLFPRMFYQAVPSVLTYDEVRPDLKVVIEELIRALDQSTEVTVDERVKLRQRCQAIIGLLEEAGEAALESSDEDDE